MIDAVKEYWNRNPCNLRHSGAEIGTQEYFDQVEFRKYKVEPHIPNFAEFPIWRGKRVLEIGCGIGTDGVNFARHGADYTAIELSERSLEIAQKRFAVYGLRGEFHLGDAATVLSDLVGPFDLIYSFGVLHHTPNPEAIVSAAEPLMEQNSEFRAMLYAANSWKQIMIEAGLDQPESRSGCPIAKTYTKTDARQLFGRFSRFQCSQTHIFTYDVDAYILHQYVTAPWFREMPNAMLNALQQKLGWHLLIKAKL